MGNVDQSPDELAHSLSIAQLEKLNLEIEKLKLETQGLKEKNGRQITLATYIPLLSVLIAVGGFLFGVLQYYDQQEKARINEQTDQKLTVQTQIRDNLNRVLQFPKEKNQTLSQIAFLLNDLDRSLRVSIGGTENTPENLQDEQRKITSNLIQLILDDCNFDEQRDSEFSRVILENWGDCEIFLKTDTDSLKDILTKYIDALAKLHDLAPFYIPMLKYNEDKTQIDEPPKASAAEKTHFRHFESLVIGFDRYLELSEDNQEFKANAIKEFQASICNETFTRQEFGLSFDPKSDPMAFIDCRTDDKKK